jgi:putative FmdB family regulatory protein
LKERENKDMPMYDYQCDKCKMVKEIIVSYEDDIMTVCDTCGGVMMRLFPTGQSFKLVYNNQTDMCSWGDDGYASSCYWNEVKEARARGEKVKGAHEE